MKRIYVGTLLCIILSLGLLTGCDQGVARSLGGDMTLELEPGQKLEMITWKEDSLWYLTRPMRDDEEPETHTFQQSSEFGVFEGTEEFQKLFGKSSWNPLLLSSPNLKRQILKPLRENSVHGNDLPQFFPAPRKEKETFTPLNEKRATETKPAMAIFIK